MFWVIAPGLISRVILLVAPRLVLAPSVITWESVAPLLDNVKPAKEGLEEVAILWGSDKVTALPKVTSPPPLKPVPAVIVIEELAKLALVIPADPDKLALIKLEMVLEATSIVLLVKISVPVKVERVPAVGRMTEVAPVVSKLTALEAVKVITSPPPRLMALVASVVESDTVKVLALVKVRVPVVVVRVNPLYVAPVMAPILDKFPTVPPSLIVKRLLVPSEILKFPPFTITAV